MHDVADESNDPIRTMPSLLCLNALSWSLKVRMERPISAACVTTNKLSLVKVRGRASRHSNCKQMAFSYLLIEQLIADCVTPSAFSVCETLPVSWTFYKARNVVKKGSAIKEGDYYSFCFA